MATIKANPRFNVEEACKELNKAMKGFGTDENKLIEVLTNHNNAQRQEIKNKYKIMYGKDLKEHIRSEVEGDFQDGLVALLYTPAEFDARTLRKCLDVPGTREFAIIEILASRTDAELKAIQECYKQKFKKELDEDLAEDSRTSIGALFRALASASRPEDNKLDNGQATADAQAMFDAGEAIRGTNESEFVRVLCSRSYAQLKKTFDEYAKIAGKDIAESIRDETTGDFEDALLAIVQCVRDVSKYFAEELKRCMAGVGTRDDSLLRGVITRSEKDLEVVKQRFNELYNQSLFDAVVHETNGHVENLIKAIVKN